MLSFFKYLGMFLVSMGSSAICSGLLVAGRSSVRYPLFSVNALIPFGVLSILMGLVFLVQSIVSGDKKTPRFIVTFTIFLAICIAGYTYIEDGEKGILILFFIFAILFFWMFYAEVYAGWEKLATMGFKDRIATSISIAAIIISSLSLFK